MKLDEGWNQIHFNLTDFTRRAYGTNYLETLRVQIHANCRIRRIYFTDQLLSSKSIPDEYRAFSNANDDNAEEQYQNQMGNDPNAHMMQGEGEAEEHYQQEYHEENQEEHQVEQVEEHQVEQVEQHQEENAQENPQENAQENPQENAQENPQENQEQQQENNMAQPPEEEKPAENPNENQNAENNGEQLAQ